LNVFSAPPSTSTSNTPLVSEVTECSIGSLFVMLISAPGGTVSGGPKLKLAMVIFAALAAAGLLTTVEVADALLLAPCVVLDPPQAAATAATRHTAAKNQIFFIVSPNPGIKSFPQCGNDNCALRETHDYRSEMVQRVHFGPMGRKK